MQLVHQVGALIEVILMIGTKIHLVIMKTNCTLCMYIAENQLTDDCLNTNAQTHSQTGEWFIPDNLIEIQRLRV